MAPGSGGRSRTPSLRRQSQPVYPMPMIIEDVAAHGTGTGGTAPSPPPILPERSPRRTRPASVPVLPSQMGYSGGGGGLSRNNSSSSIRAVSERGLSTSSYAKRSIVGGGGIGIGGGGLIITAPDGSLVKSEAPRHQDPERLRKLDRMARRGGWYKLVLLTILLVGVIVGLGVGLTLGLRKRNNRPPPPELPVDLFPAGSYAFTTALTNISTGCLPSTYPTDVWQCLGGSILSSSNPESSSTTYHWIIEPTSRFSYVISSSPLSSDRTGSKQQGVTTLPTFTNLSLTLHDANQLTERLTFSFTMPKSVRLQIPLSHPSNSSQTTSAIDTRRLVLSKRHPNPQPHPHPQPQQAQTQTQNQVQPRQKENSKSVTCFFNTTQMSATIYTRMGASFPSNISEVPNPVNASRMGFAPWPFRVEIKETDFEMESPSSNSNSNSTAGATGGTVVPDCRDDNGRAVPLSELVGTDEDEDGDGGSGRNTGGGNGNGGGVSSRSQRIDDTILQVIKRRGYRRQHGEGDAEEQNTDENENENACSCRYSNFNLVGDTGSTGGGDGTGTSGKGSDETGSSSEASPIASTAGPTIASTPTPTPT